MKKIVIWRNDDIGVDTDLESFKLVHQLLKDAGQVHTIALVTKNLARNKELVGFIQTNLGEFGIQVHCHGHEVPLTELTVKQLTDDLTKAIQFVEKTFGVKPTILFPPWNKTSKSVEKVAGKLGLVVSTEKVSLDQFIRVAGDIGEDVVNFHSWSDDERAQLPKALAFLK